MTNLPPGCSPKDLPGCSSEDEEIERDFERIEMLPVEEAIRVMNATTPVWEMLCERFTNEGYEERKNIMERVKNAEKNPRT